MSREEIESLKRDLEAEEAAKILQQQMIAKERLEIDAVRKKLEKEREDARLESFKQQSLSEIVKKSLEANESRFDLSTLI